MTKRAWKKKILEFLYFDLEDLRNLRGQALYGLATDAADERRLEAVIDEVLEELRCRFAGGEP